MTSVHHHRVRHHEVDAQGLVFNCRFLQIADVAMGEYFRALGWPYPELLAAGVDPSVVKAEVEYLRPARLDDSVDTATAQLHPLPIWWRLPCAVLEHSLPAEAATRAGEHAAPVAPAVVAQPDQENRDASHATHQGSQRGRPLTPFGPVTDPRGRHGPLRGTAGTTVFLDITPVNWREIQEK
jgi:hypothetical protein